MGAVLGSCADSGTGVADASAVPPVGTAAGVVGTGASAAAGTGATYAILFST